MCYRGVVKNGVIVLKGTHSLPEGTEVEVSTDAAPAPLPQQEPSLSELLLSFAGTIKDLPEDMARNHDHYLHGTPKRYP